MTRSLLVVALFGFLVCLATGSGDPTEVLPGVLDLTPETFKTTVTGSKAALVEFYAPWCGHCKHLVPEYKKLGELVQNDPKLRNRVVIAKVDADAHRSVGEAFDVKGFPTIKFFPRGKVPSKESVVDYNAARTAEGFLEYIKNALEADKSFARVASLDELAKDFTSSADKAGVAKKVAAAAAELTGEDKVNGDVYVKLLDKAVEKGIEYLTKEKARLDKILASGSVASAKLDELSRKASVLGALIGTDEE